MNTVSVGARELACRLNNGAVSFAVAAEGLSRTAMLDLSRSGCGNW